MLGALSPSSNGFVGAQHAAPGADAWRGHAHPALGFFRRGVGRRGGPRPAQMLGATTPAYRWCSSVGARYIVPGADACLGAAHLAIVFLRRGAACCARRRCLARPRRPISGVPQWGHDISCPAQMLASVPPIWQLCFFVGAQHAAPGADAWRDHAGLSLVFLSRGVVRRRRTRSGIKNA